MIDETASFEAQVAMRAFRGSQRRLRDRRDGREQVPSTPPAWLLRQRKRTLERRAA